MYDITKPKKRLKINKKVLLVINTAFSLLFIYYFATYEPFTCPVKSGILGRLQLIQG